MNQRKSYKKEPENDEELSPIITSRKYPRAIDVNDKEELEEVQSMLTKTINKRTIKRPNTARARLKHSGKPLQEIEYEYLQNLSKLNNPEVQEQTCYTLFKQFQRNQKDKDYLQIYLNPLLKPHSYTDNTKIASLAAQGTQKHRF